MFERGDFRRKRPGRQANAVTNLVSNTDQRGFARPVDFADISNQTGGDGSDIGAFEAQVFSGNPPRLTGAMKSGSGSFQFAFTNNSSGVTFTVLTTTNLALPINNWTVLGGAIVIAPGQYQFTDPGATNYPQRFYQVVSP
ncbi:MAG: choice-of-anchor Q domain-containing protein [Verrucomicrobiia bacterium]